MIDQKAQRQTRLFELLCWLRSHSDATSYDVWRGWVSDTRRQRVSSDTTTKDLRRLCDLGFVTRYFDVRYGCRVNIFTITCNGLQVIADKEHGINAPL